MAQCCWVGSVAIKDLIAKAKDKNLTAEAKDMAKDFKTKSKVFEAKATARSHRGQGLVLGDTFPWEDNRRQVWCR